MRPFIIAIAGGTGSGKSTLEESLSRAFPGKTLIIHMDDYFRKPPELPRLGNYLNWDHPESIYIEQLNNDLLKLKQGQTSVITQEEPIGKREYEEWSPRKRVKVDPMPLIILEGFLALHYPQLRKMYDFSIFLDAPFETRIARRVQGFPASYDEAVIKPMHDRYVAPSKRYADLVIDVAKMNPSQVLAKVIGSIPAEVTTTLA